jgi:hypothetical protein
MTMKLFYEKRLVGYSKYRYNNDNNTPQAYFLIRSSAAQTEGLLIFGSRT